MRQATERLTIFLASLAVVLAATAVARAEPIKIGAVKSAALGALYIATDKGYFAAAGFEPQFVDFDSPGGVPVAVVSGAIDVGSTGSSAEIYTLAAQGAIKIIAGQAHEQKGFQVTGFILSNAASAAGLTSLDKLAGHSVAISQVGSPVHYAAALVALKHGITLDKLRFLPLQTNPNILSAVIGGTADTGVIPATIAGAALAKGDLKLLGWVGDEAPWQSSAVVVSQKMLAERADTVKRFLDVLRKGLREFHDAFSTADGTRRDGPTATEVLAILSKHTGQPPELLRRGVPYVDPEARLDFKDMERQLAWFTSQNMLKGRITLDQVIDRRFAVDQPGR